MSSYKICLLMFEFIFHNTLPLKVNVFPSADIYKPLVLLLDSAARTIVNPIGLMV
jgi:hypothetical protein